MSNYKEGEIIKGQITGITSYGIFLNLEDDYTGLVHISEVSDKFVKDLPKQFNIGDLINVKVISVDEENKQVKLSIKKIDYKTEDNLSMIPESGKGFGLLEENLAKWTETKYKEISKANEKMSEK